MKTWYLNMVLDDTDNLVNSYDSLGKLQTRWKQDMADFLKRNGVSILRGSDCWYPYFTCEDEDGEIVELSIREIRGGADMNEFRIGNKSDAIELIDDMRLSIIDFIYQKRLTDQFTGDLESLRDELPSIEDGLAALKDAIERNVI